MMESWFSSAYCQEPLICSGVLPSASGTPSHCRLLYSSTMRSAMNGLPISTGSENVIRSLAVLMVDTLLMDRLVSNASTGI